MAETSKKNRYYGSYSAQGGNANAQLNANASGWGNANAAQMGAGNQQNAAGSFGNANMWQGGTGFAPRDITPEATLAVIDRNAPGISEAIRAKSLEITPKAMLSRAVSGIRKRTLIINLPGSPKAVREALEIVLPVIPHAVEILSGDTQNCGGDYK